jgi:homoserine O-succinyltransferase
MERESKSLSIGLINNMPDGALEATEQQFLSLLDSASDGLTVRLELYSLPDVPRGESGHAHVDRYYSSVEDLWNKRLDGLIVTGREPLAPSLAQEPYWPTFTKLLDWAEENTHSAVWSCLAAHAAVFYMDGIGRVKNNNKISGVFDCKRVSENSLTAGMPSRFRLPHSRWNGVSKEELTGCGYQVLTLTEAADADTFIKQRNSMFVFFQGHPEYTSSTLLLEYRRDVGRYLRGEAANYPVTPHGYFPPEMESELIQIQRKAKDGEREGLLADLSSLLEAAPIENSWKPTAEALYKNWLSYICAQKMARLQRNATSRRDMEQLLPALAGQPLFASDTHHADNVASSSRNLLSVL